MYWHTSNRIVTYEARHYRNCSSRNLFWHKKQRYVYSSGTQADAPNQGIEQKCKNSSKKDLLDRWFLKIFIQELTRCIPEELSDKHQCKASSKVLMQGPLEADFNRISTRSSHKDVYEIMQGHLEDSSGPLRGLLTRNCTRSCKGIWQYFTRMS